MDARDDRVRGQALHHLATVLGVPESMLVRMPSEDTELGRRQAETMQRALEAVADAQLAREMVHGTLLLSLDMYCAQMVRCSRLDPARVERVLFSVP